MPGEDKAPHALTLLNRSNLRLEGVQNVDTFGDETIVLLTNMGTLTIRGHKLRIQHLDLDKGQFMAEGDFEALVYSRKKGRNDDNVWKKMWR